MDQEWAQQPGETNVDYQLLLAYLQQGGARTYAGVDRMCPGYGLAYIRRLAKAWLWDERADVYDAQQMQDRLTQIQKLEAEKNERWSRDQLELAELGTQVIRNELRSLLAKQAQGQGISGTTLTQLMDRLHKWMQLATGGATDRIDTSIDLSKLSETDRALLQSEAVRKAIEGIAKS